MIAKAVAEGIKIAALQRKAIDSLVAESLAQTKHTVLRTVLKADLVRLNDVRLS